MIKLCVVLILLTIIVQIGNCQPSPLEVGAKRLEFSDVVVADSLSKQLLFQNAETYVQLLKSNDEIFELKLKDSIDGKLFWQSKFLVYSQTGILRKMSGVITYLLSIEVKENKYRYRFSDFIFHYYKQDRYFKMIDTGKTKNLEDSQAPGWQKLWIQHKSLVLLKTQNQIKNLKMVMMEKQKRVGKKMANIEW